MDQNRLIYKNNFSFKQFKKKLSVNSNQYLKKSTIKVLILGSGFAGIEVLKQLQRMGKNFDVEIILVSKDNFFLFTPMLPEVVSGMIEIRHIVTPVRTFCKNARFYEADIKSIDLKNKNVVISTDIGRASNPIYRDTLDIII